MTAQSIGDSSDYYTYVGDSDYYYYSFYYFWDSSPPTSLISSTNSVLIHFESDSYGTRSGFQLEYHQYST